MGSSLKPCTFTLTCDSMFCIPVGIIIMTVDKEGHMLVTGDVDGLIKVWDIAEHCLYDKEDIDTTTPRQLHTACTNKLPKLNGLV